MTESSVRVGVRIRPLVTREKGQGITIDSYDNQSLVFKGQTFTFDHVFGMDMSQNTLYERTAAPMLKSFLEGYNCTIMAYGQTGSGKTFTMGTADHTCNDPDTQGLIPRFVMDLFENLNNPLNKEEETSYKIKVSFLEIYGEDVFDLLSSNTRQNDVSARTSLPVREDENGRVFVQGQTDIEVKSPTSTLEVLAMGSHNRVTASTAMNAGSSRSHAVFTILLEQTVKSTGSDDDVHCMSSKLTFVDLAGSERIKRTGAEGQRMKEGIQINSGLFNLGQVINSLADEQKLKSGAKTFVPYRNSKLTHLLKDALGGNSQTLFLACVSPADSNDNETYSTLNYARQARNIQNKPIRNMDKNQIEIRKLKISMKTWMLKAVQLMFGPKLVEQQVPAFRSPTSSKSAGILSPAAATFEASCKSGKFDDTEELLRRPDVIEFINSVNASIMDKLDGAVGPSPRKIRLSTGVPLLPKSASKMFSPSGFGSPSRGYYGNTAKKMFQEDDFPNGGFDERRFGNGGGRESILMSAELNGALEAANQIEDSEQLVERMIDMVNKEKKLLGVQGPDSEAIVSAAIETGVDEQQSSEEILEVDRLIQEKEEILNKLLDNVKGYAVLKNEFEKLVDAINSLEEEKKELEMELEKAKKTGTGGNVEKMKERFNTVKKELDKMREDRNKKEQAYKVMQRESKQCEAMQKELHKLKEAKVTLMRQQKSQFQQLQKLKKESAQKISVFKKNDVKKQQQVNSLKDELKKKERILTLKEKELGRVGMKLRACEDHITQLLKIQNRNRTKGTTSSTTSGASSNATNSNNTNNGNRVNLKVNPLEKFKGQLESSEFDHLVTSKGLLEQVVISQVDRKLALQSYIKKTNQLKQLNADLLLETSKLENLLAVKATILDEYKNTNTNEDPNATSMNIEEEEFVQLDSLPIEVRYKLEAVQTDILFTEDVVDEISKEIDDCNIELDELSLRMEEYGTSAAALTAASKAGVTVDECISNSNELNWEYIGREIVSSLSNSQTQVLIMDFLSDKASLLEKCRVVEGDYKKARSDYEISSEKASKYLQHLEKLRDDFHDRLSKIEKQRINDVWAILKAHQTDTLFTPSDGSATATAGSAAAETAQMVAIQRAADLEKELESAVANEESLQTQLKERMTEVSEFKKKCESLEINLQVTKKLMEGMNSSSSSATDSHGRVSVLSDEYIQHLSNFWDQIGTTSEDRQNTLDYLLKCNELAQARALKDAEDGLHSAKNELKQRHDYLVIFSSMLGKDLSSFLSSEDISSIGGGSTAKTMEKILTSLPKLQSLSILQQMLNKVLTEILTKVNKLLTLKENLLTLVAEMWLELHDLPKSLQTLYHLKIDNLVPLLDEMENMSEVMMEIKCKEVMKVGKYLVEERSASLQDMTSWEMEIKKLNLQRVQVTNALVALREKILSTINELELKETGNNALQNLITSALQSPCATTGNEVSPQVIKTTIQVLSMKSASNPPGSLKLQDAMERVKLLLDSLKCNRNAVAVQLKKFIDHYISIFDDRDLIESQHDRKSLFLASSSGELIFKNSSLDLLFTIIEDISMKLNYARFYAAMQIKTMVKTLTGQTDDKIMDQIYFLLQKKVQSLNGELEESNQTGGWTLAQVSEEITEELTSMSMFVEENWIQSKLNEIMKNWNSIPCDDLEVANASSPISLRILSIETYALKMELKRLESINECFQELKSNDLALIKHIAELEEFEHTSKENRAKVLSGNSKLLMEEEKFRKNAKKKFEMITEKMVQLYAKLNVLASGGNATTVQGSNVLSSPTPVVPLSVDNAFIEVKIDINGFSIQGQTLLKGGVTKEKVELMRLHTLAGAASSNVQVSNVAAPTVASSAASSASAGSASMGIAANNAIGTKRRLSNEKEEKEKAPPSKKEAREVATTSSVSRTTTASSTAPRKEIARPGFSKPTLQSSKQGSFKGSSQLTVVAPNFMLPDNMQGNSSPTLSSSSNLPPPPPTSTSNGMRSPKGTSNKTVASKFNDIPKPLPSDENNLVNRLGGPSDEEIHAALMADGVFGQACKS